MISFKGKGMCDIVSIVCCLARCHHVRLTEHVTELWLILPADGHVSLLFHLTNSSVQETWHFVRWLQLYCTHDFKRPWGYEAVNHCQMFSILKVFYRPRQSADYYGKNVTCTNAKWGVLYLLILIFWVCRTSQKLWLSQNLVNVLKDFILIYFNIRNSANIKLNAKYIIYSFKLNLWFWVIWVKKSPTILKAKQ